MANSPHLIGMHYSGPTVRAALVQDDGKILEKREIDISPDTMLEQVAGVAKDLASKSGRVAAVGFGIPGLVNRQTDVVIISQKLPSTIREGLHAELTKAIGLRVEIENDANAAAYGEYLSLIHI